jgi:16S rRNA G527 N7-methylase RsmG
MVESKVRKAAFLREAVRTLGLPSATVQNVRFQELTENASLVASADLVTVRAVKIDAALFEVARHLLRNRGRFLLFGYKNGSAKVSGFGQLELNRLMESTQAHLGVLERVFHVEQPR